MIQIMLHRYRAFIFSGCFLMGLGVVVFLSMVMQGIPTGIFALYLIIEGILSFIPFSEGDEGRGRWVFLLKGAISLALGVMYFLWPTLLSLFSSEMASGLRFYFIAVWGLATGAEGVILFFLIAGMPGRTIYLIGSLLPVAMSVGLFLQTGVVTAAVTPMLGAFGIIYGVLMVFWGRHCRNVLKFGHGGAEIFPGGKQKR